MSLSASFSLAHSLSLLLSFSPLSLFSCYLLIKIEFLNISSLRTLFLLMFGQVHIYSLIEIHTLLQRGLKYIHHQTNITWTHCFWGSDIRSKNAKKTRKHLLRCTMPVTLSPRSTKQITCSTGLWRLCEASTSRWLFKTRSQPFPQTQKPVPNTFTTCGLLHTIPSILWGLVTCVPQAIMRWS